MGVWPAVLAVEGRLEFEWLFRRVHFGIGEFAKWNAGVKMSDGVVEELIGSPEVRCSCAQPIGTK